MPASRISFELNGAPVEVETSTQTSAQTMLLQVLRGVLEHCGTRVGCSEGYCGACTIWLDGRPVQACTLPVSAVAGRSVTTIEMATHERWIARVQNLFLEEQAAQCGYCSNGLIMGLAGLMKDNPVLTRAQILHWLDERHLCRCGAHPRLIKVVDRLVALQAAGGSA